MFQFMILLETFPPSPFCLKRIFEKVGKWKIFRFVGKSSLTKNIPIDRILEDFSPFANVQIYGYISFFLWLHMYFIPQYFLEVGAFGVSERIVTEDFCEIFQFFYPGSTKRAKRSCPDGERAQCPSQSCEAECNWGGTCCWVGDGGCLFLAEKWRYMLLSENVHDTDDNF